MQRNSPLNKHTPSGSQTASLAAGVRLRRVATGLLLFMACVFLASIWAARYVNPQFVWLRAFAEAALVGGLADWFAVTALFRHPMGLPIPHTAIIPRSKDRIGHALADFLRDNFLTPRNVARRLGQFDAARALAGLLERPAAGGRIRTSLHRLIISLAETPAASALMQRLQQATLARLHDADLAPLLGQMLAAALADGRHQPVIDDLLRWVAKLLDEQEGLIRSLVEERTAWMLRLVNIDDHIANQLVGGLRDLLDDVTIDPEHPLRRKADAALHQFAADLQNDPATRERVEAMKREIMANPAVARWVDGLLAQLKQRVAQAGSLSMFDGPGRHLAASLRDDADLAAAINQMVRRAIVGLVADHGDQLVRLIPETVKGWDAATITGKLESAVLRDLQYIRLNGTLIGGTIGLALHAVLTLAG